MEISPARSYLIKKIEQLEHTLKEKKQNLKRFMVIREDMNH